MEVLITAAHSAAVIETFQVSITAAEWATVIETWKNKKMIS